MLALLVWPLLPLVPPNASHGQETVPDTQSINWQGPLVEDAADVLAAYYNRLQPSTLRPGCRADRGELCFNGDPEDQRCRRTPCRSSEEVDHFLADLAEAAAEHPGDALAYAHAVYAYARFGRFDEAMALGRECAHDSWWCGLVMGMVHDRADRPEEAEAHFRSALTSADSALAARLAGIGELLDDTDRLAYERLDGDGRTDFEQRFWWLTDPMWSVTGNDRWAEHIRRRFELVLHENLLEEIGHGHPERHEIVVVRRGHEDSWSSAHLPAPRWKSIGAARYRFSPVSGIVAGLGALRYHLQAEMEDERYTPASYGPVLELPRQLARFREGDSLAVVAAARPDEIQLVGPQTVFMVSDGPGSFPVTLPAAPDEPRPVFRVVVAPGPVVVGIESLDEHRTAARVRAGLLPLGTEGLVLSDPLLVTLADTDLPRNRDEAVDRMLGTTTVESGDELGVYWEVYGVARQLPLRFSVAIQGDSPGWLTRGLRALRLRSAPRMPEVSWTEPGTAPTQPMAITVDISDLDAGEYVLRMQVVDPGGSAATSYRHFKVGRR